ncbi:MAG: hypothetical protein HQK79_23015 [Desulfobacterales bacterium]|nr:hypothetical protein [Desulfobacterales bacterium]
MISKEEAKEKFKEILKQSEEWKALIDSQFVDHLSTFQSWALRDALFKIERAKQEFFLSTCINRYSLLAHAEDREYLPRKASPSYGKIKIINKSDAPVSLPMYQSFLSDSQLEYVTMEALIIQPKGGVQVKVNQMSKKVLPYVIYEQKAFYEIIFESEISSKIRNFSLFMDTGTDDSGNKIFEKWEYSRLFQNASDTSKVYDEFFTHDEKVGIRFGNGNFGKIPLIGTNVQIELWLTYGNTQLIQGQKLYIVDSQADIEAVTIESITGGFGVEDTEEIRRNLHYWSMYNEKLIWREDYVFYIKRKFPELLWIYVWSESENEKRYGRHLDHVNRICISAYAKDKPNIGQDIIDYLETSPSLNKHFRFIEPIFSYFDLTIDGKVDRQTNIEAAKTNITDDLKKAYDKDSKERRSIVYVKDFYDIVNNTGYFEDQKTYFDITNSGKLKAEWMQEMICIGNITVNLNY